MTKDSPWLTKKIDEEQQTSKICNNDCMKNNAEPEPLMTNGDNWSWQITSDNKMNPSRWWEMMKNNNDDKQWTKNDDDADDGGDGSGSQMVVAVVVSQWWWLGCGGSGFVTVVVVGVWW